MGYLVQAQGLPEAEERSDSHRSSSMTRAGLRRRASDRRTVYGGALTFLCTMGWDFL
jgi:hypothetical protein